MIPVHVVRPKPCTYEGCRDHHTATKAAAAVMYCPRCGEARCARHQNQLPTRSCCASTEEPRNQFAANGGEA